MINKFNLHNTQVVMNADRKYVFQPTFLNAIYCYSREKFIGVWWPKVKQDNNNFKPPY